MVSGAGCPGSGGDNAAASARVINTDLGKGRTFPEEVPYVGMAHPVLLVGWGWSQAAGVPWALEVMGAGQNSALTSKARRPWALRSSCTRGQGMTCLVGNRGPSSANPELGREKGPRSSLALALSAEVIGALTRESGKPWAVWL